VDNANVSLSIVATKHADEMAPPDSVKRLAEISHEAVSTGGVPSPGSMLNRLGYEVIITSLAGPGTPLFVSPKISPVTVPDTVPIVLVNEKSILSARALDAPMPTNRRLETH
jgi:hypothetical protein